MLDYLEIIFGTILTVISSMILGYFLGALGSYAGIIIVTACIGYRVNKDLINGAFTWFCCGSFGRYAIIHCHDGYVEFWCGTRFHNYGVWSYGNYFRPIN